MTTRFLLGALVAALFLPSAPARADSPRLVATVGRHASFTISLNDASGNPVKHLDPGTYDIAVHDLSEAHNFHLHGAAVDEATDVGSKQEVAWRLHLAAGNYLLRCDPHASVMNGWFTVGDVPATQLSGAVGPKRS